jgi:hypothetical protein
VQRRNAVEAVQQGRRVQGGFRRHGLERRIAAEPHACSASQPGAPGQGGAGQRAESECDQFGQVCVRPRARCPVAGTDPRSVVVGPRVGVGGEAEAPPFAEPIRIDEVHPAPDVAAEIERRE